MQSQGVEREAFSFGMCAGIAVILLWLAFLCGCAVHVVEGMPVVKGDKKPTHADADSSARSPSRGEWPAHDPDTWRPER
jgi:hypothetical protein